MASLKVKPSTIEGSVRAPASKSYTHRAVILASLAEGKSTIKNPLSARDTLATVNACRALGAEVAEKKMIFEVHGDDVLKTPSDIVDVENSGTTMRLITAVSSLVGEGFVVLTGDASIRRRPMQPLLDALSKLGVECWSIRLNGLPPIIVKGGGLKGGETEVSGEVSSQFISGLLIASAKARNDVFVKVVGRQVSRPYIDMTIKTIEHFGGGVESQGGGFYRIPSQQRFTPASFEVPGDFSSASLILAMGLLAGGKVTVTGLNFDLPQADQRIIDILRALGAGFEVHEVDGSILVFGGEKLKGGDFDLSDSPDLLPVVSILALKARDRILIRGVEHTRFKESDRISVLSDGLRRLGCRVEEFKDGLMIEPPEEVKECVLDAHGDHRLFMAYCAAGLASSKGCVVRGLESLDVSYPSFLDDVKNLGGILEAVEG